MSDQAVQPTAGPLGLVTKIERDAAGLLVVHQQGRPDPLADARVARCFPWSLPSDYISIRTKEGKEVALLRTLDELDPASRQVVEDELHSRIFNPRIQRVVDFKEEFGVSSVTAQTDRGVVTFQIRTRDDVRVLSNVRALFRDADGNTYELHDLNELDPASRRRFHQYF